MNPGLEAEEAPFASRRRILGGLAAVAIVLGILVVVDALPRLNPPPPKVEGKPFLAAGVGGVDRIDVERGRKKFRLERTGAGWEILDPTGRAAVPDDRVDEFLQTLADLVVLVDIGAPGAVSVEDFGLGSPQARVTLHRGGRGPTQVSIGDRNPPLTGAYALVSPGGRVALVGAAILLEIDKLAALASVSAPREAGQMRHDRVRETIGPRPSASGAVSGEVVDGG